MNDSSKFKQILAKEILLFVGILLLTGLIGFFLFCRNYYYENKVKSNQEMVSKVNLQIGSLPFDKLKVLYRGINEDFVSNYSVNNDKYLIPKKQEQKFLKDYPTATLLPISHKGYSYTHLDIFKKYGGEEIYPKQLPPIPKGFSFRDSTTVFDFVSLSTFRHLLKDDEYKDKLYKTFSEDYDLGTKQSFDSKINAGLKFNSDVVEQKLLGEKQLAQNNINSSKGSIKSHDYIYKFILWTIVLFGIVVYPLRLFVILLKWSFKNVRENAT
nr:hypothetical protein [uncultured Pedobacter sp.]